jgi:beta-carotene hydroxylase
MSEAQQSFRVPREFVGPPEDLNPNVFLFFGALMVLVLALPRLGLL